MKSHGSSLSGAHYTCSLSSSLSITLGAFHLTTLSSNTIIIFNDWDHVAWERCLASHGNYNLFLEDLKKNDKHVSSMDSANPTTHLYNTFICFNQYLMHDLTLDNRIYNGSSLAFLKETHLILIY